MPPDLIDLLRDLVTSLRDDRRNLEAIAENTRVDRGQTVAINKLLNVFSAPGVAGPGGATAAVATQMGQFQKQFNDIQRSAIAMGRDFQSINSTEMIQSLEDSYGATISMQAALEAFNAGVGLQSKSTIDLAAEMKATGQNSAAMLATMREAQVLGNLTNTELDNLAVNLDVTSKQYGISSDNLVKAINVLSNRMQDYGAIGLAQEVQRVMVDMTAKYGAGSEQLIGQFIDKITKGDNLANLQKLGIAQDVVAFGMNATADQLEIIAQKAAGSMQTLISQMESGVISRFQALRMAEDIYGEEGKLALLVAQLDKQEVTALGTTDATEQLSVQTDKLYDAFYNLAPMMNAIAPTVQVMTMAYSLARTGYDATTASVNILGNGLDRLSDFLSNEAPLSVRFFETELGEALDNIGRQASVIRLATDRATGPEFRRRYTMGYFGEAGGITPGSAELTRLTNIERGLRPRARPGGVARSKGGSLPGGTPAYIGEAGRPELVIAGAGASVLSNEVLTSLVDLNQTNKLFQSNLMKGFTSPDVEKTYGVGASPIEMTVSLPKEKTKADSFISPPIAQNPDLGSSKMLGASMALTALTTMLSQLTDGNNKAVEYMAMISTGITTLVTLQQAASMLGGLGGLKSIMGGLAAMLPALVPVLLSALPLLIGGGLIAGVFALANREKEKTRQEAMLKPAEITTNEYMRVSMEASKGLFSDLIRSSSNDAELLKTLQGIRDNTDRGANLTAGVLRASKNSTVLATA